jgi:hypothetical protein
MKQVDDLTSSAAWERGVWIARKRDVDWCVYIHVVTMTRCRPVGNVRSVLWDCFGERRRR